MEAICGLRSYAVIHTSHFMKQVYETKWSHKLRNILVHFANKLSLWFPFKVQVKVRTHYSLNEIRNMTLLNQKLIKPPIKLIKPPIIKIKQIEHISHLILGLKYQMGKGSRKTEAM